MVGYPTKSWWPHKDSDLGTTDEETQERFENVRPKRLRVG
jgi:hypothetical protein